MKLSHLCVSLFISSALAGCAYVIPPDENAPRNNLVIGNPHRPMLNGDGHGPQKEEDLPKPQSAIPPAKAEQQAAMAGLPPVDEATKAQAAKEIATQAAQAPAVSALPEPRRVPEGNQQFQVAANDNALQSVPPRPDLSGPDSVKDRLTDTQETLQKDWDAANSTRDALARDAAAEPSMLPEAQKPVAAPAKAGTPVSDMRRTPAENQSFTVAALPEPETPTATPQVAPELPPQQITAPVVATNMNTNLPNTPAFSPPAPLGAEYNYGNNAASPTVAAVKIPSENPQVASLSASPQEIAAAPLPEVAAAPAPAPQVVANASMPAVNHGDFDPMAPVDAAPMTQAKVTTTRLSGVAYASANYLAPSRYAARRL